MPLFGEIIEPSSRAIFCDDSSEDEERSDEKQSSSQRNWKLKWNTEDGVPLSLQNVLIFQGRLSLDFFQFCVLKDEDKKIGEVIEVFSSEERPAYYRKKKPMSIYKLTSDMYACLCPEVDYDDCNIILDALLPLLSQSKEVTILASAPAPQFKCSDPSLDLPSSFMRVLYSASFNGQKVIAPVLEHPNIVTGIAASVLSWCEVFKVPGCLYICYSDSEEVDSISAEPLLQIFSKYFKNIVNISKFQEKSHMLDFSNNLYM